MSNNKNPGNIIKKIKNNENERLYLLDMVDPFGLEQYIIDTYKEIEQEFPEMIEIIDLQPIIPTNDNDRRR